MRRLILAALIACAGVASWSLPASAAPQITVSPNTDLDPAGASVTVKGSGYDTRSGIYVAWCVVPPAGQKPTPCGGGDDRSGSSGSVWISSNPVFGASLAKPYGPNGTFEVQVTVTRMIGDVDCFVTACAVTTRNDHENTEDRSQDVFGRVTFRGQGGAPTTASGPNSTNPPPTASRSAAAAVTSSSTPSTALVVEGTIPTLEPVTTTTRRNDDQRPVALASASVGDEGNGDDGIPATTGAFAVVALLAVAGGGVVLVRRRP